MNRDSLLKQISECGYNVGFGAKKHFATYDIISKGPGIISFISICFGIFSLVFTELSSAKVLSAVILIIGVVGIYLSCYEAEKKDYAEHGDELIKIFNDLKSLYFKVKDSEVPDVEKFNSDFKNLEEKYYQNTISKQVLLSDWYAHYKFFWQHQIDWINEQKNFTFWRDKVPLSFAAFTLSIISILIFINSTQILGWVKGLL